MFRREVVAEFRRGGAAEGPRSSLRSGPSGRRCRMEGAGAAEGPRNTPRHGRTGRSWCIVFLPRLASAAPREAPRSWPHTDPLRIRGAAAEACMTAAHQGARR